MSSSSGLNLEKYLIPLEEINRATDNFNQHRCIGGGGFGKVYKGQLSESWGNQTAAIKRLDPDSYQGEREFRNEIDIISKFHHENIISFVGYCDEEKEMIIVYEYAINGSLDHHLRDPAKMRRMTWTQRLQICIGAAQGLNYLHSGLGKHNRVIHRDVKSANILLDGNLVAKVCDFGLSKLRLNSMPSSQVHTKVAGTHFYMDPAYHESRILQKESDVYSFGVVLFEMLSGMLVYSERSIEGDTPEMLMTLIRGYDHNNQDKLMDPYLRDQVESKSFDAFKEIAYQCISLSLKERPAMETAIEKIEKALSFHAGAIPLFIGLLTASDSKTQDTAVSALHNLSCSDYYIGMIVSSGAVPGIVHVLRTGCLDARVKAAALLVNLCRFNKNTIVTINAALAIPPLLLLLMETFYTRQEDAATVLFHLCKDEGNTEIAVGAGVVPILLKILPSPVSSLVEKALNVLSVLSSHPEGKLAILKAGAVPVLAEAIRTGSLRGKENAAAVLVELCSIDQMCLAVVEEHEVMRRSLMDLLEDGTYGGQEMAKQLLEKIEVHRQGWPACVIC